MSKRINPLMIVTTYNRLALTQQTLEAVVARTDLGRVDLHVVDNGSTDGTAAWLTQWARDLEADVGLTLLADNIGCPRALNLVMERFCRPGQHVVKLDNDVIIQSPSWHDAFEAFLADYGDRVGMLGAWYPEVEDEQRVVKEAQHGRWKTLQMSFLAGHFVWYTARLLDIVGYFDVLGPGHVYGFEDNIMCHKANLLGLPIIVLRGVQCEMIQRASSLGGDARSEHVAHFRAEYNRRVSAFTNGGSSIYTGPDGQPEA